MALAQVDTSRKIICSSNQTAPIYFNTNELIFFESLRYPRPMICDCEMSFIIIDDNPNTKVR